MDVTVQRDHLPFCRRFLDSPRAGALTVAVLWRKRCGIETPIMVSACITHQIPHSLGNCICVESQDLVCLPNTSVVQHLAWCWLRLPSVVWLISLNHIKEWISGLLPNAFMVQKLGMQSIMCVLALCQNSPTPEPLWQLSVASLPWDLIPLPLAFIECCLD